MPTTAVTGTPGIGKSFFMYYCFWALVRGPGTAASAPVSAILWEHHRSPGKMWMYRNGQVLVGDRKAFDCELDAPSSWCVSKCNGDACDMKLGKLGHGMDLRRGQHT